MISPELIAASSSVSSPADLQSEITTKIGNSAATTRTTSGNLQDQFQRMDTKDTIEHMINDCDLASVGMEESEARKILRQLMTLKTVINTPTLNKTGHTPQDSISNVGNNQMNNQMNDGMNNNGMKSRFPYKRGMMEGAAHGSGSSRSIGSSASTRTTASTNRNALQTFQHSWKHSMNMTNINGINSAMIPAFSAQGSVPADLEINRVLSPDLSPMSMASIASGGTGRRFPKHSKQQTANSSMSNAKSVIEQHGDQLDSLVSNQITLKLQQAQLEAAITKSELLDELKAEVPVVDPTAEDDPDEYELPRISAIMNSSFDIERFADDLQR